MPKFSHPVKIYASVESYLAEKGIVPAPEVSHAKISAGHNHENTPQSDSRSSSEQKPK